MKEYGIGGKILFDLPKEIKGKIMAIPIQIFGGNRG